MTTKQPDNDIPGKESLIPGYQWLVSHPGLLGGRPTIIGTRLSVALILECFAAGMTVEDVLESYPSVPSAAFAEVFRFASQLADNNRVAS